MAKISENLNVNIYEGLWAEPPKAYQFFKIKAESQWKIVMYRTFSYVLKRFLKIEANSNKESSTLHDVSSRARPLETE